MLECAVRLGAQPLATRLAIAPYFGEYNPSTDRSLGKLLNTTLPAQIAAQALTVRQHAALAAKYNISLVTYEAGVGMQGSGNSADLNIQGRIVLTCRHM